MSKINVYAKRWLAWSEKYAGKPSGEPQPVKPGELEELQERVSEVDEIAADDPFAASHWPMLVRNIELNTMRPYHFSDDELGE